MTPGETLRDLDYESSTLPRRTFARSIFDNQLVQLSDRGGASQLIGAAWSEVAAAELNGWTGGRIPVSDRRRGDIEVTEAHRLDTIPGVASRASKAGLKNPDFILFGARDGDPVVLAVDAKFSVETAKPVQVSAETTSQLFEADERLATILPEPDPEAQYVNGLFVSPDYVLTHAMFERQMGHRRLTVSPGDVVLADVEGGELLRDVATDRVIQHLVDMDRTAFPVWESLLATQYYFRLERAIVGLVSEEQRPLLGTSDIDASEPDLLGEIEERSGRQASAWQFILEWDKDVEEIRRQRQSFHQVVGSPLSSAKLRELSDEVMDEMGLVKRPSRNRVRKALGAMFMGDVLDRVGVIKPPVADLQAELERVATVSREVSDVYAADMRQILLRIITDLTGDTQ